MFKICLLVLVVGVVCAHVARAAEPQPLMFIGGYDNTVTCFALNEATGELKELSKSDCGKNPTYLAFHPNRKFLYAANELEGAAVSAFSIDPKDGKLTKLNDQLTGGKGNCHVAVHPDGKWLFSGNYGSGHVGICPIKEDGSLGTPLPAVLGGKNAHQVVFDPLGKFVFVPFLGSNCVNQYVFDEASGKLTPNDPPTAPASKEKAGPRHMALHPNMKWAYVIDEQGMQIDRYDYDKQKGVLSSPQAVSTLPEGTAMDKKFSTAHILVSPDGKFLYGSNRGHNTIAIFSVDPASGALKLVGHESGDGEIKTPRDFSLDLTGKYCIVASQDAKIITVFARDEQTGKLKKMANYPVAPKPAFVGLIRP